MKMTEWLKKTWRLISSEDATGLLFNSVDRSNFSSKSSLDYLSYNDACLYLNRAIDMRAEKVSEVEFVLSKRDGDIIEDPLHPVLKLLNRPNKWHTGKQFWKLVQKYIDITGEAYVLMSNERELFDERGPNGINSLIVLPTHQVKVVFSDDGTDILRYEYTNGSRTTTYPGKQVLRFYEPDPMSPARGASLLTSGIRQIETDMQLTEYQVNILKNGGFVDGVFKFKTAPSREQIKDMEERYKEKIAAARSAGTPLFLGGDADYIRLGLNPAELAYLESKKLTLNDMSIMTGVPAALLAITSQETFSNAEAAQVIFLRDKIKPLLDNLVTILDWRLVPEDLDLDFVDPTPANTDEMRKNIETASTVYAISTNEKREMLVEMGAELDPITDPAADEIFVPFNMIPLAQAAQEPQAAPATEEEKAGRKVAMNHPLRDPLIRKRWGEIQIKRLDRRTGHFKTAMQRYFDDQEKRLLQGLTGTRRFRYKGVLDRIFDDEIELRLASKTALPLLRQYLEDAGVAAFGLVGSERFEFNMSSTIERWLNNRAHVFADEINETTFAKLQDQFSESFANDENREQLIARIQETYKGFNETRATTIARTEVHGAMQKGTIEGYRQAGVPIKIWVWAAGVQGGVRPDHMAIDGEERPLDRPFSNGLMFPGDAAADAGEIINCECSA